MISATLLVGVLIGALATGAILNQRVEELQALRRQGGVVRFMERIIEPTDARQRAELRAVLDEFASRQMEIRQATFEEHRALFNTLREELDEILTPEQKQDLRAWMDRESRRGPRFVGPPPFAQPREEGRRRMRRPDSLRRRAAPFDGRRPPPEGERPPDSTARP